MAASERGSTAFPLGPHASRQGVCDRPPLRVQRRLDDAPEKRVRAFLVSRSGGEQNLRKLRRVAAGVESQGDIRPVPRRLLVAGQQVEDRKRAMAFREGAVDL